VLGLNTLVHGSELRSGRGHCSRTKFCKTPFKIKQKQLIHVMIKQRGRVVKIKKFKRAIHTHIDIHTHTCNDKNIFQRLMDAHRNTYIHDDIHT